MIVVLSSGQGRTFEALARKLPAGAIGDVISNVETAPVRAKARALGIREQCVENADYPSRALHEDAIFAALQACSSFSVIALLGYMRIFSATALQRIYQRWPQVRIINLHPAPPSLYKGAHGLAHAIAVRAPLWGVSVHEVTEHLDSGPLLAYRPLPVLPTDTFESLRERAHPLEVEAVVETLETLARRSPT
ncbi:hypothetical protein EBU99_12920 [bacterium]|nr:hypothetical protein [bacterium]